MAGFAVPIDVGGARLSYVATGRYSHMYVYTCIHVCICICMYICVYISMYVQLYVCASL